MTKKVFERDIHLKDFFTLIVEWGGKHFADFEFLSCPQIESVTSYYYWSYFEQWSTFLNNHRQLKKLTMNYVNYKHFVDLTANSTSLEEVILYVGKRIDRSVQEIGRLLQSHPNLIKAHLVTEYYAANELQMQILRNSLANEWDFDNSTVYDYFAPSDNIVYECTFIRKNSVLLE